MLGLRGVTPLAASSTITHSYRGIKPKQETENINMLTGIQDVNVSQATTVFGFAVVR